jgi:hypothetical protein
MRYCSAEKFRLLCNMFLVPRKPTPQRQPALSTAPNRLTFDCWVRQRYAERGVADPWALPRYAACRDLMEAGIASIVWFEDAMDYYGVDTICFNVHIIVQDVNKAQSALIATSSWVSVPQTQSMFLSNIQPQLRYLRRPEQAVIAAGVLANTVVSQVLMPAALWCGAIVLPDATAPEYLQAGPGDRLPFMPRLPDLLNALLALWLDTVPAELPALRVYLTKWITGIVKYVPVVRDDAEFVARLTPEHRQLFLDVLAGVDIMALESYAHERMIRDLVRAGEYSLVPCSVSKDDERFYTKAVWARIAAGQRAVAGAEAAGVTTEGLAHDGGEESTVAATNEDRKKKAKKLGIMSSGSCLNMVPMLCGAIGGLRSRRGDGDLGMITAR